MRCFCISLNLSQAWQLLPVAATFAAAAVVTFAVSAAVAVEALAEAVAAVAVVVAAAAAAAAGVELKSYSPRFALAGEFPQPLYV